MITLTSSLIKLNKEYEDDLLFQKLELEAAYEANDDTKITDINFRSKSSSKFSSRIMNQNWSITTSSNHSSLKNNLSYKYQYENRRGSAAVHHQANSNSISLIKEENKKLNIGYQQITHDFLQSSQSYQNVICENEDKLREIILDKDYTIEQLQNKIENYKQKIQSYNSPIQNHEINQNS